MKIAFVHDFLAQHGGAERVLAAMHALWPFAPIHTIIYDPRRFAAPFVYSGRIIPSFLQQIPLGVRRYQWFLPLMPSAVEQFDLRQYDMIISSSSAFAKGIVTRSDALHICYCHTPTRYLWTEAQTYIDELPYHHAVKRILPLLLTRLRLWDYQSAQRVDMFIANSLTVQRRIQKYYGRSSTVIHPPVPVSFFAAARRRMHPARFFLAGGRLVPYKRFDVLVEAFNRLGIPLVIFGTGPEERKLRGMAKPHIRFVGQISDTQLRHYYANAEAFLNPQEEDFGMTAVESMASGTPVIAYERGGAMETVIDGTTGMLVDEQSWEAFANAVVHFDRSAFDASAIRAHAAQFDISVFQKRLRDFVMHAQETASLSNALSPVRQTIDAYGGSRPLSEMTSE